MFAAVLLVGVAQKLRISYPIALVIGGTFIGFIPGLPPFPFDPQLILLIVLPPILYSASFTISFREFKANWREIFSLALGLVFFTTLIVGLIFKWIFPEFPWALAFAFGAIISPPDAIAANAILKRFSINSRLLTILEGESLVNDASALVFYRLAIVALLSGVFSLGDASFEFIKVGLGGIVVGLILGWIIQPFSRRFLDPVVAVVLSITIPYVTYIFADYLGVSGVLAVVANGLVGSQVILSHPAPLRRILGFAVWDIYTILFNCFVFVLIGLQLKTFAIHMSPAQIISNMGLGVLFTAILIGVRLVWVYGLSQFNRSFGLREATLVGWAGMRGIVSLTVALALPLTHTDGSAIDGRNEVIFITFVVILLSLLIPGFTLAPLIRLLKLNHLKDHHKEHKTRKELEKIAHAQINRLRSLERISHEEFNFLTDYFTIQRQMLEISSSPFKKFQDLESLRLEVIKEQRKHLLLLWEIQEVSDSQLAQLEHELDLEETRIARAVLK